MTSILVHMVGISSLRYMHFRVFHEYKGRLLVVKSMNTIGRSKKDGNEHESAKDRQIFHTF